MTTNSSVHDEIKRAVDIPAGNFFLARAAHAEPRHHPSRSSSVYYDVDAGLFSFVGFPVVRLFYSELL